MADRYYKYDAPANRASIARPGFPGYLLSEGPSLPFHQPLDSAELHGVSSDFLQREGYSPPVQDPSLICQRRDISLGISTTIPDMIMGVPGSVRNTNGSPLIKGESNILFVDGLPTDCTRREVSRLFCPFIGRRKIRVLHKEPRRVGDRALVLCFVEFIDSKCARTAMDALHGYKFDDEKPESSSLRIQFAHFPFHLPSDGDEKRVPC